MEVGTRFQKIHAINKAKKYQLLGNIFLCSMAVLTCIVFSSFFLFTTFSGFGSSKAFVFGSVSKLLSVFFSYKSVFIFGNVIVIVLIGESKFFAPNHPATSDAYYNEYINQKRSFQTPSTLEVKKLNEYSVEKAGRSCVNGAKIEEKTWVEEKNKEKKEKQTSEREDEPGLSTEELNRRADDFISRVNKQRRLEARLLVCYAN